VTRYFEWSFLLTVAGLGGLVFVILQISRRDPRVAERVKAMAASLQPARESSSGQSTSESRYRGAIGRMAGVLLPKAEGKRNQLRQLLSHAGYYSPSALSVYVTLQFGLAIGLFVLAVWLCGVAGLHSVDLLLLGTGAAGAAYLIPGFWLRRRQAQRHRILNRSLPDFLDLLVTCLEAGLSLEAVSQGVTRELGFAHPLLAEEMTRVQREIELGATPDRALHNFAERTGAEVVRSLATVCHQARKYGAKVSAALRVHADVLRDQREQQAEEAAQKASVKILFPTLLCLFPAIFVVLAGPAAIQIAENFSGDSVQTSNSGPNAP
jgi:tight adherence protein C